MAVFLFNCFASYCDRKSGVDSLWPEKICYFSDRHLDNVNAAKICMQFGFKSSAVNAFIRLNKNMFDSAGAVPACARRRPRVSWVYLYVLRLSMRHRCVILIHLRHFFLFTVLVRSDLNSKLVWQRMCYIGN